MEFQGEPFELKLSGDSRQRRCDTRKGDVVLVKGAVGCSSISFGNFVNIVVLSFKVKFVTNRDRLGVYSFRV